LREATPTTPPPPSTRKNKYKIFAFMKILPIINHSGDLNLGVQSNLREFCLSYTEVEIPLTWNSGTVERMSIMMEASRKMELTITNTCIKN
jgi:hypothetical protein